jgi:hypothetical protein
LGAGGSSTKVAQLQTQLQNEKTLRMGLERALEEASDPTTLSPQPSVTPELAHHVSPHPPLPMNSRI